MPSGFGVHLRCASSICVSIAPQDFLGGDHGAFVPTLNQCMNPAIGDDGLPYSTSELNAAEYSTDDFRMFSFKVSAQGSTLLLLQAPHGCHGAR